MKSFTGTVPFPLSVGCTLAYTRPTPNKESFFFTFQVFGSPCTLSLLGLYQFAVDLHRNFQTFPICHAVVSLGLLCLPTWLLYSSRTYTGKAVATGNGYTGKVSAISYWEIEGKKQQSVSIWIFFSTLTFDVKFY